ADLPRPCTACRSRTRNSALLSFAPTSTMFSERASAIGLLLQQSGDLVQLPLQPPQLRVQDHDVGEGDDPRQRVDGGDVVDVRLADHRVPSARRRNRVTCSSRRLPRSSTRYIATARLSIAASAIRNVKSMLPSMFAPWSVNVIGWITSWPRWTASTEIGIRPTPSSAYTAE